ncbi:MAG: hypothetical protein CL916_01625, partial [Deltaproteobacteria bacterium]|nr:hypothetical protein [Deltaproteobacteria bacterium]
MGSEKTLFSFGCSEEVCETLRSWLFQTGFIVESYTNYKRVWADLSRRNPEIVFINVDLGDGLQLLNALREESSPPLLVGVSSGVDRSTLFFNMFSSYLADYYVQRPLKRGFLDVLLARILNAPAIVKEHNKVELKELTDMVKQRDDLKEENRKLNETITELLPQRDELQLQLAELLSASSKYGAEIEKLEVEYEKTLSAQEDKFEEHLKKEQLQFEHLQGEHQAILAEE